MPVEVDFGPAHPQAFHADGDIAVDAQVGEDFRVVGNRRLDECVDALGLVQRLPVGVGPFQSVDEESEPVHGHWDVQLADSLFVPDGGL